MKQLIDLQNKNYDLDSELMIMRFESEKSLQSLNKLNDSDFKFVKMLTHKKTSNDRRGIAAKKDISCLHVLTDIRTIILSRTPFLISYVNR